MSNNTSRKQLKIPIENFVKDIITKYGVGHEMITREIVSGIAKYDAHEPSIRPADYCYNWYNKDARDKPCYFKRLERGRFCVLGEDYNYNGDVRAKPDGESSERIIGYCVNGIRIIDKLIYPDEISDNNSKYVEGAKKQITINAYERDPKARIKCIEKYRAICDICEFDFGKTYGKDFEGMIHVHHLKPISECDGAYVVDPIKDLRPVCPNCHMVLHAKQDVYSIDEVKSFLKANINK